MIKFFLIVPTAEFDNLCPGGPGFKPNLVTLVLEGNSTFYLNLTFLTIPSCENISL